MVEEKAPELIQKPSPEEPIKTITPPAKKERKKKEKPKNPVSFTPVKKNLNRYTVSGNVNSKGTKYRVTEIIDAQDDKIEEEYNGPYHDFNGITSKYGAHFILKIDHILMKEK